MNGFINRCKGLMLIAIMSAVLTACGTSVHQAPPAVIEGIQNVNPERLVEENYLIDAKVLKVTDGDTMKISIDGQTETIRLLLIDTPESVHPDIPDPQPFAVEASNFAKKMLSDKDVQIEIDVSERDKYGRLLCYLYLDGKMFNELLLEKGFARVAYVYPPNVKYVDQFRALQDKAREKGVGIWSIEDYALEDGFHEEAAVDSSVAATNKNETGQPITTGKTVPYKNCTAVRAAGAAPIRIGDPGYGEHLDRDDGIACE